jgi:hypothetical protein
MKEFALNEIMSQAVAEFHTRMHIIIIIIIIIVIMFMKG